MPAFILKFLGLLVLLASTHSQALTLGRVHGAALIGRALDVSVQVQLDPGQTAASACFEADVFHADTRQDPASVQVLVEPTQVAQSVNVRVLSGHAINEPIVTVYLRAGCALQISRRYVLLADIVSEQATPVAPRVAQVPLIMPPLSPALAAAAPAGATSSVVAAASPEALTAAAPPAASGRAGPSKVPRAKAAKPAKRAPPPPPRVEQAKAAPATVAKKAAEKVPAGRTAGQSRLTLESLELLSERVATLESSAVTAPQAASGALEAERLAALEASVKTLIALATRNEASLLEIRTRLREAESVRYMNPVVYGLAALLLLSLAGLAYLLLLRSRERAAAADDWWQGSEQFDSAQPPRAAPASAQPSGFTPVSEPSPLSQPGVFPREEIEQPTQQATQVGATPSRSTPNTEVDVSLVEMSESTFDRLMQSGAAHNAIRRPHVVAPSVPGELAPSALGAEVGGRSAINSDELFDIRQRAEFFVSLGQTDQAVQILEHRIAEHGESSPQAFLDLLKLFHSLGLKDDFRQVREDFNLLFNARVPEFALFGNDGKMLEDYPDALDVVAAAWETPEVLEVIESLLLRDQRDGQGEQFDLTAFLDLLMLHSVAQAASEGMADGARAPRVVPQAEIAGAPEIDIDLSVLDYEETVAPSTDVDLTSEPQSASGEEGNLIDFDLPEIDLDALPKKRE